MKIYLFILIVLMTPAGVFSAESNETMDSLTNAEAFVKAKLDEFLNTDDYRLLIEARDASFSMNPRHWQPSLSELDERCLRLQIKAIQAVQAARDMGYDHKDPNNRPTLNVIPPFRGKGLRISGMDPKAIKEPDVRQEYEEAIADNHRKNEKLRREVQLSRSFDRGVIAVWYYIRNLPADSNARTRSSQIIKESGLDPSIISRLESEDSPGLTY